MNRSTPPDIFATINAFEAQHDTLRKWLAGLSDQQVDSRPVPNTWTPRQLIVHMLDSDLAAGHRMRRIAAEDKPLLIAYDETALASVGALGAGDLRIVADLFSAHRRWCAAWLRSLEPERFDRVGIHNQRGKVTLAEMVSIYVQHVKGHEPFMMAKRAALGVA
jgi:hypothetical protein